MATLPPGLDQRGLREGAWSDVTDPGAGAGDAPQATKTRPPPSIVQLYTQATRYEVVSKYPVTLHVQRVWQPTWVVDQRQCQTS